jgi:hypothetical protein
MSSNASKLKVAGIGKLIPALHLPELFNDSYNLKPKKQWGREFRGRAIVNAIVVSGSYHPCRPD